MSKPYCPTHDKELEPDLEDSSEWECPECGYGFYLTNPDIIWKLDAKGREGESRK